MTTFVTHTTESAPAESRQLLTGAKRAFGFIPNLLGTMAEAPVLLEGYLSLAGIFDKSSFSETERQIVLMTNNRLNGCTYCMSAHTAMSKMGGVPEDVIQSLRSGTPIADSRLEALRQFAMVINTKRGWPDQDDIDAFFDAGYTKQNLLEVILGTSLKVMSNYTNNIAETELDDAFKPFAWTPTDVKQVA